MHVAAKMTRLVVLLALAAAPAGCGGMARSARQTGQMFDNYGCLAQQLKGKPCPQAEPQPAQPPTAPQPQQPPATQQPA